jgi:hypothetical protein
MPAPTAEELLTAAQRVLESRGFRVVQADEATAARTKFETEQGEADSANASEDEAIATFKQLANDYTKQ